MSYCAQTWSGQNANRDMYFHTRTQTQIESHLAGVGCVPIDCDQNGLADEDEILEDPALDKNGTGILDVCEDCNANDVLDDQDIASERSTDRDGDGVPDECQPDCNGNGQPDSMDVETGISIDAYGDGVPDECEVDCDGDGTADYTQIQLDVTVDLNRNRVLDACEDCDADGTLDAAALDRSHNLWIASGLPAAPIYEFHGDSGVQVGVSESAPGAMVAEGQDVIVVGSSRVLVASGGDDRVKEFTVAGAYVGNLVEAGAGGLQYPTGLLMLGDGRLLVASRDTNEVLAYDGVDGTPLGAFVEATSGLVQPHGMVLGPAGDLFVGSDDGRVVRCDGETGALLDVFVDVAGNAGLSQPRGMAFKPDGNLLVASFGTNEVLEYDGESGAPLGKWARVGTDERLTQISPWGVRVAPSGNVFVARTGEAFGSVAGFHDHDDDHEQRVLRSTVTILHLTNAQIYEFDSTTGDFLRTHVGGNDHDLLFPTGFDFVPGYDMDCNLNFVPDGCDIAEGTSLDLDLGGVPDECEVDCNTNGIQDRLDVIPYGVEPDCDNNLRPDACDLADGADDCNANGVPDTCETTAELGPQPMVIDDLGVKQVDGFTTLNWFFQGGLFVYDVAGSTLSSLRADGSVVAAACLVDDHLASAWSDPRADPPSGDGFYYLVRSQSACLESNWGQTGTGAKRLLPAACR